MCLEKIGFVSLNRGSASLIGVNAAAPVAMKSKLNRAHDDEGSFLQNEPKFSLSQLSRGNADSISVLGSKERDACSAELASLAEVVVRMNSVQDWATRSYPLCVRAGVVRSTTTCPRSLKFFDDRPCSAPPAWASPFPIGGDSAGVPCRLTSAGSRHPPHFGGRRRGVHRGERRRAGGCGCERGTRQAVGRYFSNVRYHLTL